MIVAVCDDLQADRDVLVSYCKRYKDEYTAVCECR